MLDDKSEMVNFIGICKVNSPTFWSDYDQIGSVLIMEKNQF